MSKNFKKKILYFFFCFKDQDVSDCLKVSSLPVLPPSSTIGDTMDYQLFLEQWFSCNISSCDTKSEFRSKHRSSQAAGEDFILAQ